MATMAERFIPFPHWSFVGMNDLLRFWAKIDKSDSSCWLWTGAKSRGTQGMGDLAEPYGHFVFHGETYYSHRVAWFFEHKQDPGKFLVCHECNVTLCVHPAHLFLGTQSENKVQCGLDGRMPRGENHSQAVLSNDDARMIFKSKERPCDLARQFGVTASHISKIQHGHRFKSLLLETT